MDQPGIRIEKCEVCQGEGIMKGLHPSPCSSCGGSGAVGKDDRFEYLVQFDPESARPFVLGVKPPRDGDGEPVSVHGGKYSGFILNSFFVILLLVVSFFTAAGYVLLPEKNQVLLFGGGIAGLLTMAFLLSRLKGLGRALRLLGQSFFHEEEDFVRAVEKRVKN